MASQLPAFSPCYTWPQEAFPFRLYFESAKLRIFIIENFFHNYNWMKKYGSCINETDVFIVLLGWHHSDWHVKHSCDCLKDCGINKEQFVVLCNDYDDFMLFSDYDFCCVIVNQNCFLDTTKFSPSHDIKKEYDAIYTARLVDFKRHYLAKKVQNLALVVGNPNSANELPDIPPARYINNVPLPSNEVQIKLNQAKVGLILSDIEGACFASSEYLLCGLPVVSTTSRGGRSIWYNSYNSIICDADPDAVNQSVQKLIEAKPDPGRIRAQHIELSNHFIRNFIILLQNLFDKYSINSAADVFFTNNYFHKMRISVKPDFGAIFGR